MVGMAQHNTALTFSPLLVGYVCVLREAGAMVWLPGRVVARLHSILHISFLFTSNKRLTMTYGIPTGTLPVYIPYRLSQLFSYGSSFSLILFVLFRGDGRFLCGRCLRLDTRDAIVATFLPASCNALSGSPIAPRCLINCLLGLLNPRAPCMDAPVTVSMPFVAPQRRPSNTSNCVLKIPYNCQALT